MLMATLFLTACMGQRELAQENDRLRERVLELETQLLRKTRESAEARARLQRPESPSAAAHQDVQANTPYVAEITIGRLSHARDTDGDGELDLAVVNRDSGDVSILLNHGDGSFAPQRRFAVGDAPNSIAIADFNGDGVDDLAVGAPRDDDGGFNRGAVWILFLDDGSCPWDLDNTGSVGVSDLLDLLASWGPCKDCPADFDENGAVGVSDLLTLLANWGPCP